MCNQRRDAVDRRPEKQQVVMRELEGAGRTHDGDADQVGPEVKGDAVHRTHADPLNDVTRYSRVALGIANGLRLLRFPYGASQTLAAAYRRRALGSHGKPC